MTSAIHKEAKEAHSSSSSCRHHNTSDGIVTGSLFSCKNAKPCGFSVKSLLGAQTGLARSSCLITVFFYCSRQEAQRQGFRCTESGTCIPSGPEGTQSVKPPPGRRQTLPCQQVLVCRTRLRHGRTCRNLEISSSLRKSIFHPKQESLIEDVSKTCRFFRDSSAKKGPRAVGHPSFALSTQSGTWPRGYPFSSPLSFGSGRV